MGKASRRKLKRSDSDPILFSTPMAHSVQQVTHQQVQIRSGPLPDPEAIRAYELAFPGAADRIFEMAEKEQSHRHAVEAKVNSSHFFSTTLGQIFGFLLGLTGICGGLYLAAHDKALFGFVTFFTSFGTLIGVFFYQKEKAKKASGTATADKRA